MKNSHFANGQSHTPANSSSLFARRIVALFIAATLVGCASTGQEGKLSDLPPLEKLMEGADKTLASGDRDAALKQFSQAAAANPTSAKPWVRIAQTEFETGNYPATIQAADEAMKRDAASKEAKALAVVASLRVAMQALSDMRKDIQLRGTTRVEAEQLAKSLRDTLGQDVLVPQAAEKPSSATKTSRPAPRPALKPAAAADRGDTPAQAPASAAKPKAAPSATKTSSRSSGDPFGALQ